MLIRLLTANDCHAGLLMISEWWASEVAVMAAGLLPDPQRQLSAMAIYQNTNALCFMIPVGLSIACATRHVLLLAESKTVKIIQQTQQTVKLAPNGQLPSSNGIRVFWSLD